MRNLGLIVAIWLAAIVPTQALALGLGEIEVKSFLNQPLEAEIEVISARPGEIDDLLVSLASREAFARAGLSRPRHLLDMRFAVNKSEDGSEAVILVTTKDGVKEPFLNFLIEADWAKGRVLREFTILLDPPFYAEQPPPVEPPSQPAATSPIADDTSVGDIAQQMGVTETTMPEPEASDSGQQFSEPIALAEDSAPQQAVVEQPVEQPPAQPVEESSSFQFVLDTPQQNLADEVLVSKGDTLWSIASRYRDGSRSMSQIMLAFQRANPAAFNDGNINNMREGAILRIPDSAELDALDAQQAYAEVLVQNGLWDEYVARVTGVSPVAAVDQREAVEVTGSVSVSDEPSGELSLLMPADGSGDSAGTGDGSELGELRNRLAMAEEELEASRIENRELESRIAELQARLSKMEELQKMVEIEDDSLAQLQADSAAEQSSAAASQQPEGTFSGDDDVSEQALIEELLAEEAAAQAEEQATTMAANDGMVSDEVAMAEPMTDPNSASAGDSMAEDQAAPEAGGTVGETQANQQSTPPAPVIITETAVREPSIFDGILPPDVIDMIPSMPAFDLPLPSLGGIFSDPLTLGALGGVVVLLLALLLYRRKKNETESDSTITASNDEDLFVDDDQEELTPIHLDDAEVAEDSIIGSGASEEPVPSSEQSMAPSEAVSAAEPQADDFAATAIISPVDVPQPEAPAAVAPEEQDDVLNEVDVYLAYGLYDNAEELLTNNLAARPDRVDYRSKLLDTYFATKNTAAFVKEAETLKSMGTAAGRFWDRVQVMGYELAPDNPLFSDAKDSGMSAADLEISKPQEADFDLGTAGSEDTSFSTTDFNLGEDEAGGQVDDVAVAATQVIQQVEDLTDLGDDLPDLGDAADFAPTEVVRQVGGTVELSDDDDTNLNRQSADDDFSLDLSDDAGEELEFSMDEGAGGEDAAAGGDLDLSMDFDIDDEVSGGDSAEFSLDDASSMEDPSEFNLGDDLAASIGDDTEAAAALGLDLDEQTGGDDFIEETAVISADFDATIFDTSEDESASEDLGLSIDETGVLDLDDFDSALDDTDDDDDISIVDFGGEDFEEPTALVDSIDDLDDSLSIDVDIVGDEDEVKTGTFSPGDFDEPTAVASAVDDLGDLGDLDDMDDLMLPDDVDEVSTKLDLARAFIDMGDTEGARGSLEEVLAEGNEAQKQEAQALLDQI